MTVLLLSTPPATGSEPLTPEQQTLADIALVLTTATERHCAGDFDQARALYDAILVADPAHGDAHYNLGMLEAQQGRHDAALQQFEIALGINAGHTVYWLGYLHTLIDAGQIKAAWTALNLCEQRGIADDAIRSIITRLMLSTAEKPAQFNYVPVTPTVLSPGATAVEPPAESKPEKNAAEPSLEELTTALNYYNAGQYTESNEAAGSLTRRYPDSGPAWRIAGFALQRCGRFTEALEALQKTASLLPDDASVRYVLGSLLDQTGQPQAAEEQYRAAIRLQPTYSEPHRLLGMTLSKLGRLDEAIDTAKRAIELAPHVAQTHNTLALILLDHGRIFEAVPHFREALSRDPRDPMVHSNLLFCLTHLPGIPAAALFEAHRGYALVYEAPFKSQWPRHANTREPERQLKICFVSGDFFHHAVASFFLPVAQHLARDTSLSLHFYNNYGGREDVYTRNLRACAAQWHDVVHLNDTQLAEQIARDEIDILIDLSGHTGRNRLPVFGRKPAPIQMSWIGNPGTTGLDAVDYYMADRFATPFGTIERYFSEKIIQLPVLAPFVIEPHSPPVNILPALHNGFLTFGSFNRQNKLRPDVIALWARILRRLPDSRLVIGATRVDGAARLGEWFEAEGIARERLKFVQNSATAYYLQQHHQIDVCLDTFPFSASTVAVNSLWMGVPTLTIAGELMTGRGSTTWMSHVDLPQFVASDADDFVEKGVALADDIPALAEVRSNLRARALASPIFRPDVVAAGASQAFRIAWRRWCQGLAPEAFTVLETETAL